MTPTKITLSQLESFLFKSADNKEFIFGMLFLKRLSDETSFRLSCGGFCIAVWKVFLEPAVA